MEVRVAVVGAGSWGTTIASLAASNTPTLLWSRRPEVAEAINTGHENPRYLEGFTLHPALRASSSLEEVVTQADVLVMGVPTHGFRATLEALEAKAAQGREQVDLFAPAPAPATPEPSAMEAELARVDPDALTPREALEALYRLKALLR